MALGIKNLEVEQGADFSDIEYVYLDTDPLHIIENATSYDFSGKTLRAQVRMQQDASSTLLLSFTIGSGLTLLTGPASPGSSTLSAFPNGYQLSVTAAQTLPGGGYNGITIPLGVYYYDIFIDDPIANTHTVLVKGIFKISVTVTR